MYNWYEKILKEPIIKSQIDDSANTLPYIPLDTLDFVERVRPTIGNIPRIILPFWRDIYNDPHNNKMIMAGRQVWKSTYATDILSHDATKQAGNNVIYVTYDDINKSGFSRQRLQIETFDASPILKQFPRFKLGNVGEISLKNNSTIYMTTDHGQFHHVEGKSANHIILDEAQYQDLQYFDRVLLTMTMTQGKITVLGIGGEAGSPYEELWERTDKREWIFDDKFWRDKLQFETIYGRKRLKIGNYLMDICRGRWKSTNPNTSHWHGYHLHQAMMPQIPLTEESAINDYDTDIQYSIQYKKRHMSSSLYTSHVEGGFYKAQRRPITREMVIRCFRNHYRLLSPREIGKLKEEWGNRIKISMGVDFGSGKTSQTVITIMIKWNIKKDNPPIHRYHMAYIDVRPSENQIDQAEYINFVFKTAKCDIGIGDYGYGANQISLIQDGGHGRITGKKYTGVGSDKFFGCRTMGDETKPLMDFTKKVDEHGEVKEQIKIDKTTVIQKFVDMLETFIPHPGFLHNQKLRQPSLLIPARNEEGVEFLIHDWTSLTRKDIPEEIDNEDPNPKQKVRKEFNHPSDTLMSAIYSIEGFDLKSYWNYISV